MDAQLTPRNGRLCALLGFFPLLLRDFPVFLFPFPDWLVFLSSLKSTVFLPFCAPTRLLQLGSTSYAFPLQVCVSGCLFYVPQTANSSNSYLTRRCCSWPVARLPFLVIPWDDTHCPFRNLHLTNLSLQNHEVTLLSRLPNSVVACPFQVSSSS